MRGCFCTITVRFNYDKKKARTGDKGGKAGEAGRNGAGDASKKTEKTVRVNRNSSPKTKQDEYFEELKRIDSLNIAENEKLQRKR